MPVESPAARVGGPTTLAQATVRVPASSANLGPGFDAFGLALTLYDEVTAAVVAEPGLTLTVSGEGADTVPDDETHLVHCALQRGFDELGVALPGVRLHCVNRIPHGRGLGSSSAAIVGGLALARALVAGGAERWDDDALFRVAAEMEGHPDNVAAAVYGGFTVAYGEGSAVHAVSLPVTAPVVPVVVVPGEPVATKVARGLLPASVPHADAAWNAGRAALLVAALSGRPEELMAATDDRIHQPYRTAAMPESATLVARLREAGVPAAISGAGPTVLALVHPGGVDDVRAAAPEGWRVLALQVDADGVRRTH
jgi:homoserine kinase